MHQPDHRLITADSDLPSEDPWVLRCRATLDGSKMDADIAAALEILEADDQRLRGALEGFLLAGVDLDGLLARFCTPRPVLEAYSALCFDLQGLNAGDKALIALDPDQPDVVRQLRSLGVRHESWLLDHLLGIQPTLAPEQQRDLEDRLLSRLLLEAFQARDTAEQARIIGMIARLRPPAAPEESSGSQAREAVQRLIDRLEHPPTPLGLPNLDEVIARPKRTQDRVHTANTAQ